jgi:hypothetical protein
MADVCLETAVRIPPDMVRALCNEPFTGLQLKIVMGLVLLSQNTRTRTVRVSHEALALELGMRPSGGFVDALRDLIARGVIVVVDRGGGRRPPTYRVCGNPGRWQLSPDARKSTYGAVRHSGPVHASRGLIGARLTKHSTEFGQQESVGMS